MTTNLPQTTEARRRSPDKPSITATLASLAIVGGVLLAGIAFWRPSLPLAISKDTGTVEESLSAASDAVTIPDQSQSANEPVAIQAASSSENVLPANKPLATKTQAGVTVAITWAYADAERVGVEYKVSGVAVPEDYLRLCPVREVNFTEDVVAVTLGQNDVRCVVDASGTFLVSQSFNRIAGASQNNAKISLDVAVGGVATIAQPVAGAPAKAPFEIEDAGVFHFDLDIPVTAGLTITEPQEIKQPSAAAVLQRVEINPSLTRAEICWQLPSAADWLPATVLKAGDEVVQGDWFMKDAKDPKTLAGTSRCYVYSFPITYDLVGEAKDFVITTNELRTSVPEVLDSSAISKAQEKLASTASGVDFVYKTLDQGFTLEITQKPIGMTDDQAYRLIADALADVVTGPWTFTVSAP